MLQIVTAFAHLGFRDGNVDRFCIVEVTICFSARMQQKQNEKLMAVEDESSDEEQLAIGGFGVI